MGPAFLTDVFTASFWFGAAATVLSFLLGGGHHGHPHLPGVNHGASAGASGVGADISPLNLNSLLVFLTVFGAVGLILAGGVGDLLAFVIALLVGGVAGWLVFLFIARFLARGQTFLADESLIGTIGTLSRPIDSGRVGEIIYTHRDVRHSDGARSKDGVPIPAGEEVVIVGFQRGIAVVQRADEFLGMPAMDPRSASLSGSRSDLCSDSRSDRASGNGEVTGTPPSVSG